MEEGRSELKLLMLDDELEVEGNASLFIAQDTHR